MYISVRNDKLVAHQFTRPVLWCRGEVWALDVDPEERRLATGSADSELRLYAIADSDNSGVY